MSGTLLFSPVLLLSLLCVTALVNATPHHLRGVSPQDYSRYEESDRFVCGDGSEIARDAINDDYCDCEDGSDEPGTSACHNGVFYCANEMHTPQFIHSNNVNDGVCDCCDGTDEYDSGVECENTCYEAGRIAREEAERLRKMQEEGYVKKLTLIEQGTKIMQEKRNRVDVLNAEIEEASALCDRLEETRKSAETPEKEAKKSHDDSWKERVEEQLSRAVAWLFSLLDTNEDNIISPLEVKEHPLLSSTQSEEEEGEVEEGSETTDEEKEMDFDAFKDELFGDIHEKFCDHDAFVPTLKDSEKPPYDEATQQLIDAANEARDAYSKAEKVLRDLTTELNKINKQLEHDVGEDNVLAPFLDECLEYIDREYKYRLCFFDRVTQEPKSGGRKTKLGGWSGWGENYTSATFNNGEKCWNGPARSMEITIECGIENELKNVGEPNRCEYAATLATPAACAQPSSSSSSQGHDEL
eukprot:m.14428 g.14428  ORF g.14428 m.14428 type:complete len:469 (+) comp7726_c0_seq1:75-1481(+)